MGHTKHVYPWSLEIEWSLRQIDIILKASTFLSSSCSGTFLLAPIHQNGREKRKGFLAPKLVRPRLLLARVQKRIGAWANPSLCLRQEN
jgi:hypothetical protein